MTIRPKRRAPVASATDTDLIDRLVDDVFDQEVTRGEAPAWERLRAECWRRWADDLAATRAKGFVRGPLDHPPVGAMRFDGFTAQGWRAHRGGAAGVECCDADLEAVAAFRNARPRDAAEIAVELEQFEAELLWRRDAAFRAGDDPKRFDLLLYGPPPVAEGDDQP